MGTEDISNGATKLKRRGFFDFNLPNILQLILVGSMAISWWTGHETKTAVDTATGAVILQAHEGRIKSLEDASKTQVAQLADVQGKINYLIAWAEEQRKHQR